MLKLLVCCKLTDDFDSLLPADWENLGTGVPDVSYVKRLYGCFDEAALENALRLKDALVAAGKEVQLTAVTLCPGYSDHLLKNLPAVHYDRVVCIEVEADLRFAPEVTAGLLADFVRAEGGFDLILTGKQAPPGNSGLVPPLLAEALGLPLLSDAVALSPAEGEEALRVQHRLDEGLCTRRVPLPLVCSMGNAVHSYLRIPTLREKLAVKAYVPEAQHKTAAAPALRLTALHREHDERACVLLPGETPEAQAAALYEKLKELHL